MSTRKKFEVGERIRCIPEPWNSKEYEGKIIEDEGYGYFLVSLEGFKGHRGREGQYSEDNHYYVHSSAFLPPYYKNEEEWV